MFIVSTNKILLTLFGIFSTFTPIGGLRFNNFERLRFIILWFRPPQSCKSTEYIGVRFVDFKSTKRTSTEYLCLDYKVCRFEIDKYFDSSDLSISNRQKELRRIPYIWGGSKSESKPFENNNPPTLPLFFVVFFNSFQRLFVQVNRLCFQPDQFIGRWHCLFIVVKRSGCYPTHNNAGREFEHVVLVICL